jgi:putative ABC transport system permease protein
MKEESRAALRIARAFLPQKVAESVAGDLEEERARAGHSHLWLLLQTFAVCSQSWCQRRFEFKAGPKGDGMLGTFWYDVRLGYRSLMSNRRFAFVGLLTILLTVGGVTAVFTLVNAILLRPLPYAESDRLVNITAGERNGRSSRRLSPADFEDFRRSATSYEMLAGARSSLIAFDEDTENASFLERWSVTPDYFPLLGIRPVLGRALGSGDATSGETLPAVLGYDAWQSRYGADPNIVGKVVSLPVQGRKDSVDVVVVGVMPPTFKPPVEGRIPGIWTPQRPSAEDGDRRGRRVSVFGRLRAGLSLKVAQAEIVGISTRLADAYPDTNRNRTLQVGFVLDEVVGDMKQVLWIFFGAVSCVLLIGVVNLTNLQMVRNNARERDLAVRAALGAGRGRLIRQLIVETVLLSSAGGALGLVSAIVGTQALLRIGPINFPREEQITIDATVYVFALGISLAVGVMFGAIPAWRISRINLQETVSESNRNATMSGHRSRVQQALIGLETALALLLLVGAALLANSFWRLYTEDAGLQEENLWNVSVQLPAAYRSFDQTSSFWTLALERFRVLPGVESAAVAVNASPLLDGSDMSLGGLVPEGTPVAPGQGVQISLRPVSPDYFKTIGVRLQQGRTIRDSDNATSEKVAVFNEAASRLLWPGENALGKRAMWRGGSFRIVGILPNFKHRDLSSEADPQMYVPYLQGSLPFVHSSAILTLKLRPGSISRATSLSTVITGLESKASVRVQSMTDIRWSAVTMERFRTSVLLMFAFVALFLALAGIFGVVSYAVTQRQREIGLRIALGARGANVARLVMQQAMVPSLVGIVVGLAASFGLTRFLKAYLFEIQPNDAATFLGVVVGLMLAALLASFIPARRACRIDPMSVLRHE